MRFEGERIERAALVALLDAAPAELAASLGLRAIETGSALVAVAAALPPSAIVINRAIGLGLSSSATEDEVRQLTAAYAEAGIERYFVQRHPDAQPAGLVDWLGAAGLEKARGWQKFHRGREALPQLRTGLRIEKIGAAHGEAFAQIVCDAFDLGDPAVPLLALLPEIPGWHAFMSFDGDSPAGAGALFIDGDLAWTDFGATAPAFRQRGSQGAILAHRVAYALDAGCREVLTCTGEAIPGTPTAISKRSGSAKITSARTTPHPDDRSGSAEISTFVRTLSRIGAPAIFAAP